MHLCAYPEPDLGAIDEPLAREMRAVRELVSLGLQVRTANKLKVRQPLARADIVVSQASLAGGAGRSTCALVREELNVHEVRLLRPGEEGSEVRYVLKPNFRALGPKLGKKVQVAKAVLAKADAAALRAALATDGKVTVDLEGESGRSRARRRSRWSCEARRGLRGRRRARGRGRAAHDADRRAARRGARPRDPLAGAGRAQGARPRLHRAHPARASTGASGTRRVAAGDAGAELAAEALAVEVVVGAATFEGERRAAVVDGEEVVVTMARAV